jgi:hypothetical protein
VLARSAASSSGVERPRSGPMRDIVATIAPDQTTSSGLPDQTLSSRAHPNRENRGRPAPDATSVLRLPAGRPGRGPGHRAEPRLPVLHPQRAARLGEVDVTQTTLADLPAGAGPAAIPARPRRSRVTGWPRCCTGRLGRAARPPRRWWSAVPGAGGSARASWSLVGDCATAVRHAAYWEMLGHRIAHVILTGWRPPGDLRRPDPRGGAPDPAGARRGGRHLAQG